MDGPADAEVLQRLDQARLGVPGRRVGRVPLRGQLAGGQRLALGQLGQPRLGVVGLAAGLVVDGLDVGLEEAREGDRAPGRGERAPSSPVAGGAGDPHADRGAPRVGHLRGDRALPDQLVEPEVVAVDLAGDLARGAERLAGRPDGLVRLLGVLDLAGVLPRLRPARTRRRTARGPARGPPRSPTRTAWSSRCAGR